MAVTCEPSLTVIDTTIKWLDTNITNINSLPKVISWYLRGYDTVASEVMVGNTCVSCCFVIKTNN